MTETGGPEEKNFRALIEQDGQDRIQDRLNLIKVFLSTEEHLTLEGLASLQREKGYDYDLEFIKNCMNRMVDLGFAHRKQFENQAICYEHRHLGVHHDHLICTKCNKIIEFSNDEMERLQLKIAAEKGFHMLQHRMEIYGLCSACLAQRRPLLLLTQARPGETLLIKEIQGGRMGRARLTAMGLRQGDMIEIISNDGQGRLIVGKDYTRIALGRGMAEKVVVTSKELQGPLPGGMAD